MFWLSLLEATVPCCFTKDFFLFALEQHLDTALQYLHNNVAHIQIYTVYTDMQILSDKSNIWQEATI